MPRRKKKVFHCKHCSFKTTGPTLMHWHYEKNPTHATKSSKVVAEKRRVEKKRAAKKRGEVADFDLPLEPVPTRPRRRHGIKFCPDCGHDLQAYF